MEETPREDYRRLKEQRGKKKYELTAHRESLRRDTNRGVRSQPDMQCTRRPLSSETTHNIIIKTNRNTAESSRVRPAL